MQAAPGQTSYMYTPTASTARPGFASRTAKMLGVLQVILGILCIIFQIIAIFVHAGPYYIGTGIWTGIFMVLAGAFGIASAVRKTNCFIVTFMVMSIIAAIAAFVLLTLQSLGVYIDVDHYQYRYPYGDDDYPLVISFMVLSIITAVLTLVYLILITLGTVFDDIMHNRRNIPVIITFMVMSILAAIFSVMPMAMGGYGIELDRDGYYFYYDDYHYSPEGGRLAVDVIMLLLGLLEMAAAIWSSAICCKATCCLPGMGDAYSVPYHVQYVPTAGGQQPVMLVSPPSGQPGVVYAIPQSAGNTQYVVQASQGTAQGQPCQQAATYPGGPGVTMPANVNQGGPKP